jgi:hypothetical protein
MRNDEAVEKGCACSHEGREPEGNESCYCPCHVSKTAPALVSNDKATARPHKSDCAVHNAPAMPKGPCDCGAAAARPIGGIKAYRTDFDQFKPWWVSQLPARPGSKRAKRDGVDWGYEADPMKAIFLTPYWARRFMADARYVGHEKHAFLVEVTL